MDPTKLFEEDLKSVDITRPLLEANTIVEMTVIRCAAAANKDNSGMNVEITLATKFAQKNDRGGTFNPGYKPSGDKPTVYLGLTETDKYDIEAIRQNMKKFRLACGFPDGAFGQPAQYEGATVKCKIGIEKDKNGNFPDKNRFSWVLPKTASN